MCCLLGSLLVEFCQSIILIDLFWTWGQYLSAGGKCELRENWSASMPDMTPSSTHSKKSKGKKKGETGSKDEL